MAYCNQGDFVGKECRRKFKASVRRAIDLAVTLTLISIRNIDLLIAMTIPCDLYNGYHHQCSKRPSAIFKKTKSEIKILPWQELESRNSQSLENFDGEENYENITVSGLLIDDVFYPGSCRTRAGPHPYYRNMRYGVFSITKSLGAAISML